MKGIRLRIFLLGIVIWMAATTWHLTVISRQVRFEPEFGHKCKEEAIEICFPDINGCIYNVRSDMHITVPGAGTMSGYEVQMQDVNGKHFSLKPDQYKAR